MIQKNLLIKTMQKLAALVNEESKAKQWIKDWDKQMADDKKNCHH